MKRARAGVLLIVGCVSCAGAAGSERPALSASHAVPSVADPALAIPSDLDVVVRVDLEPIRAALPAGLASPWASAALGMTGSSSSAVVRSALLGARQVWIGWRPGPRPEHWDNVVVLRGDFSKVDEALLAQAFHPPRDRGGGWRTYDARERGGRAAPARLYAYLEDLWVVASAAEIDAVDRILDGQAFEPRLEPPEQGVVSLAARLSGVVPRLRHRAPKAAEFLSRARTARASADLTSAGLDVSAEMEFEGVEAAERAASALRLLLLALAAGGPSWLEGIRISTTEATVALKAQIPHQALEALASG